MLFVAPLVAEEPPEKFLETLPAESRISVSIRNVDLLDGKIEKIEKRRGWQFSLKTMIHFATSYLKVNQGIDWGGNFSACVFDWGDDTLGEDAIQKLVVRIPFHNDKLMAQNFNLTAEQFAEGKIHHLKDQINGGGALHACRYGNSALLCKTSEPLEKYLEAKPLSSVLTSDPEERLSDADFLFQVNANQFRSKNNDKRMKAELAELLVGQPDELQQTVREVVEHIEYGFFAVKLDEAVHTRMQITFDKNLPEPSQKLLSQWGNTPDAPSLKGFPDREFLFGMSKTAGEIKNSQFLQQMTAWAVKRSLKNRALADLIAPYLSPKNDTFYGVIDELWNTIIEARSAVYKNENPTIDGLANLLIILKPENREQFTEQLAGLIKLSRGNVYKPDQNQPEQITDKEIKTLIEQLGSAKFQERASASLRLKLLGELSLPHLQESSDSSDFEVAGRSKQLVAAIKKNVKEQTENLLKEGLTALPIPKFIFYENQRQIAGHRTDLLEAVWEGEQRINEKQLHELVGPQGHEILLVHVNEEIVLFWGSDRTILEECIQLLENDKPGMAVHRDKFVKQASPRRLIEVHASMQRLASLIPEILGRKPTQPMPPITDEFSSFGFEVAPTHFIGDATFPFAEYIYLSRYLFF